MTRDEALRSIQKGDEDGHTIDISDTPLLFFPPSDRSQTEQLRVSPVHVTSKLPAGKVKQIIIIIIIIIIIRPATPSLYRCTPGKLLDHVGSVSSDQSNST